MAGTDPARFASRLCLAVGSALAVTFALYATSVSYVVEREIWLLQATGWTAVGSLLLSLSATPVRIALEVAFARRPRRVLSALRRSLGMTAAWFAIGHAGIALSTYLWESWPTVTARPFLRSGLVALVILVALLTTSFPRVVRALRIRLWKPLHRLAYLAALFAFQHLLLSPFADRELVFWLFGASIVLASARFLSGRGWRAADREEEGSSGAPA